MKLFDKYNRINIIATLIIFLLTSLAYYFTVKYVLIDQVDDDLKIEQREVTGYVAQFNRLPENIRVGDQIIDYTPVSSGFAGRKLETIKAREDVDHHEEDFRQIRFSVRAGGQWYLVTVAKSLEETDDFIHSVIVITVITILLILSVTLLINRFLLRKLWSPFNQSLQLARQFNISETRDLNFPVTNIEEFHLMNRTFTELMKNAQTEYLSLKAFSENASHEIQTPIAIIQSKLDLLIQNETLSENQTRTLQDVYDAILRLSRLNSSLLLLVKIENQQYANTESVNFRKLIEEKIHEFQELWHSLDLTIESSLQNVTVKMNPFLADILLNNLLGNATKYSPHGEMIRITLMTRTLSISNRALGAELDSTQIFQRFQKTNQSQEGNGLGLSIVREICNVSGFSLRYFFREGRHEFLIEW